jgi:hypothetical protein
MDTENHYHLVRALVKGSGNFKLTLIGYDDVLSSSLKSMPLQSVAPRTKDSIANFRSQAAKIKFEVTELDENFQLTDMRVYIRPIGTSFPVL